MTEPTKEEHEQTARDGIPQEARANGAGIAPLHPYAQWDKDHPTEDEASA